MSLITVVRNLDGLVFDATLEETHKRSREIVKHPIQRSAEIVDHSRKKPTVVTLKIGVSDTPLYVDFGDVFSAPSRARRCWELLVALQDSGEPFSLQTGLDFYPSMLISDITVTQDSATSKALFATIVLEEVTIVNVAKVKYPARKKGVPAQQGSKKNRRGTQQATEDTPATEQDKKSKSALAKLSASIRGE